MRANPLCSLALASAVGLAPLAAAADTAYLQPVPYSDSWFPTINVRTGSTLDIALEPGDVLAAQAIYADHRWSSFSVSAGPRSTPHIVFKPSADMDPQLVTIPTSGHVYHVILESGPRPSTAYTVAFFDPHPRVAQVAAAPAPTAQPPAFRFVQRYSCATMNARAYSVHGDPRVPIAAVCDDGVRTYLFVGPSKVAAVPYRVDPGGHQDQLVNPLYGTLPGSGGGAVGEWVLDGVFDHLALLADSSRGQIRVNIDRVTP